MRERIKWNLFNHNLFLVQKLIIDKKTITFEICFKEIVLSINRWLRNSIIWNSTTMTKFRLFFFNIFCLYIKSLIQRLIRFQKLSWIFLFLHEFKIRSRWKRNDMMLEKKFDNNRMKKIRQILWFSKFLRYDCSIVISEF